MTYRITDANEKMFLGVQKRNTDGSLVYEWHDKRSNANLLFPSEEEGTRYLNGTVPGASKQFSAKELKTFKVVADEPAAA